jgi:bacterioferritin-associated ferredoxin
MIVCSCNVLSDHQVRSTVAKASRQPRMSHINGCLGSSARCGRCAHTIKRIIDDMPNYAIGSVTVSANLRKHCRPQDTLCAQSRR